MQQKVTTISDIFKYAKHYAERYNLHLVPVKPNSKQPIGNDWGQAVTPPTYWQANPTHNIGTELFKSNMCSMDGDCSESIDALGERMGLPFNELRTLPTIRGSSKGYRLMLRTPAGLNLPYCKLTWPSKLDPTGEKHKATLRKARDAKVAGDTALEAELREEAKQYAPYTVLELRAGDPTKARQDLLPPSIHPDTGKPYTWEVKPPHSLDDWPTPPDWLLTIWQEWDKFGPQLRAACPWIETPEAPKPRKPPKQSKDASDVQDAFNEAYDLPQMLETYGYEKRGQRYLSPHSSTNIAGVHLFKCGQKCWVHHASDPLCSEEKGNPVSCYDLYTEYEHNGDRKAAFKAAAELMGIELKPKAQTVYNEPPVDSPAKPSQVGPAIVNWVHESARGKPLSTLENVIQLCSIYGINARYNCIKKEEEILIPSASYTIDNAQACAITEVISYASRHQIPTGNIAEYLTVLSDRNQYNPVVNWVTSKAWDGNDRFEALVDSLGKTPDRKLTAALLKRWLLSAIAAAFEPNGVAAQGMLVLQGPQGTGKTSWFKALLGDHQELGKEGVMLNPADKDSVKIAISHWLVELGELDATFKKADIAALKAFITNQFDEIFLRYSRKSSKFPRRTVFFASVNGSRFLMDETGNRRYWTIATGNDINPNHDIDMQQLWAQIYELYKQGERWELTKEEHDALKESNENHEELDPIAELIDLHFDFGVTRRDQFTATEIALEIGIREPKRRDLTNIGKALRDTFSLESRKSNGKLIYDLPPPKRGFK